MMNRKTDPAFIIFTGPMFGSKTTKMLASIERYRYQNRNVQIFKPTMDDRYSSVEVCTHSGARVSAEGVSNGNDILAYVSKPGADIDIVAVDEAFMIDGCAEALIKLFKQGKTIIVSSLQLSASGNAFEEVRDMMPWATKVEVCPAVCPLTGRDAFYTHKKFEDLEEIAVGGSELYEPRCWEFHTRINLLSECNDK